MRDSQLSTFGKLVRRVAHGGANRLFDLVYGVDTQSLVPLSDLTLVGDSREWDLADRKYEAAPVLTFASIMRSLPANRGDFIFIDYGSGKGRVLLLAARYGFKRVVGVEFAQELYETSERNVDRFRRRRRRRLPEIQLVMGDAVNITLPNEPCVLFLYNPFPEEVLSQVLAHIEDSYARAPRTLYLVYLNPRFLRPFDKMACLRLATQRQFFWRQTMIYRTVEC